MYDDYDDWDGGLPAYALDPPTPKPATLEEPPAPASEPELVERPTPMPLIIDTSVIPDARYVYVTGSAGTGKTTIMRAWAEKNPGAVLCATTGIAAVNLGDAVTVNSLLGYFDLASLRENYLHSFLQARLRKLRTGGITRLILDEVSMLEAEALTLLVRALEEVNNEAAVLTGDEPQMGLTLVGDFLQLPPIGAKVTDRDGKVIRGVERAKYAFEAPEWNEHFAANVVRLTKIHRQADLAFVHALQALRKADDFHALDALEPCLTRVTDPNFNGTTIYAKNAEVDRHNMLKLRELQGDAVIYTAIRDGKERPEWKNIPPTLVLKPGALVMVLSNFYDNLEGDRELIAANGDLGEYLGVASQYETKGKPQATALVRLKRNDRIVTIPKVNDEFKKPTGDKKKPWETVGTIAYMPLRLAYATTVHKSQGLTLDNVQLSIADPFWSAPAMLYVGVSRARTLEGLRIVGTLQQLRAKAKFDARVEEWR
jgi:ATP-dependent exoDNAse (exonuclease V) alpha subunit